MPTSRRRGFQQAGTLRPEGGSPRARNRGIRRTTRRRRSRLSSRNRRRRRVVAELLSGLLDQILKPLRLESDSVKACENRHRRQNCSEGGPADSRTYGSGDGPGNALLNISRARRELPVEPVENVIKRKTSPEVVHGLLPGHVSWGDRTTPFDLVVFKALAFPGLAEACQLSAKDGALDDAVGPAPEVGADGHDARRRGQEQEKPSVVHHAPFFTLKLRLAIIAPIAPVAAS